MTHIYIIWYRQKHLFAALATLLLTVLLAGCGAHRSVQRTSGGKGITFDMPKVIVEPGAPPLPQLTQRRTTHGTKWGDISYNGTPWVSNLSKPYEVTRGLQGRHIAVWQSHGYYYDREKGRWKWQRPLMFGTTEDLYTQTIVVPFLIPMLEQAGANVFTPRERDWQTEEVIVDNDNAEAYHYIEQNGRNEWKTTFYKGFAQRKSTYDDGENPFIAGSARQVNSVKSDDRRSLITYLPTLPKAGRYAVYVSYQTLENSVSDARYTVRHRGQAVEFRVNQRMGGSTWVYLGTFDFDAGTSTDNCVQLSNVSSESGVVTADAVRFGGGMGNIRRGGTISGMPRFLEGARYAAQWYGMPYYVYGGYNGNDDYKDDINVRSHTINRLAGSSPFMPSRQGMGVPLELSLAVHSDAGYQQDFTSLKGSLTICTTATNNGLYGSGLSRQSSKAFAQALLDQTQHDLQSRFGQWNVRALWDKNYSETRLPDVPAAIFEMLSHQNFPDMVMGQDPNFKFTIARSIYKTILRTTAKLHGDNYTVAPLPPLFLSAEVGQENTALLKWQETTDTDESTAHPTAYIIYKAIGKGTFDNGTIVEGTSVRVKITPGVPYSFKITAINRGGESFPSEVLSVLCQPQAQKTVLVVNGFHRLAAPAVVDNDTLQGFDFNRDPGVSYIRTAGWSGRQLCFDKRQAGSEGPGTLGYSDTEWQGKVIAGNTFDYVRTHADAIASAGRYNVCSCSSKAVEQGKEDFMRYHCVDLLLGLEKFDRHQLVYYKTFTPKMQERLAAYAQTGGALLVSGSYVGSDMTGEDESRFLDQVLHLQMAGTQMLNSNPLVNGLGTQMDIYRALNEEHYAATAPDILQPTGTAFAAMSYGDETSAAVAYQGADYRSFTMGFPFECITSAAKRDAIMGGILTFLMPAE